jgi:tRNA pseudouridine13 synthase
MLKFKEYPEDFIVEEFIDFKKQKGDFYYYILEKKNYNTLDAVNKIAEKLKINKNKIRFAGLKDRKAVTKQYISIYKYKINQLKLKDVCL